jgi:hypothetical protein
LENEKTQEEKATEKQSSLEKWIHFQREWVNYLKQSREALVRINKQNRQAHQEVWDHFQAQQH